MKKASSIVFIALSILALNIQRPPVADKAKISEKVVDVNELTKKGKKYKLNIANSTLGWIGTKPTGKHNGTIGISEGSLTTDKKNNLTAAKFVLNMVSINDLDMEGKGKEGLENHLKSPDFFDATQYPNANFELTSCTAVEQNQKPILENATHNITGNLTMKGITKSVTFPAIVNIDKKVVTATADFNIDRTEWGINYGTDGKVAKEINLKLHLEANK